MKVDPAKAGAYSVSDPDYTSKGINHRSINKGRGTSGIPLSYRANYILIIYILIYKASKSVHKGLVVEPL